MPTMHKDLTKGAMADMHKRVVAHTSASQNTFIAAMVAAVVPFSAAVSNLAELDANVDPTHTKQHHVAKVGREAKKIREQTTKQLNVVGKEFSAAVADNTRRINERLNIARDWTALEVLATLRSKSNDADKHEFILALVEGQKGPALAAIRDAGWPVTQLSEEQVEKYVAMYAAKHAPDLMAERQIIDAAYQDATAVALAASTFADDHMDTTELAEIERKQEAARKAEQAMQPHTEYVE